MLSSPAQITIARHTVQLMQRHALDSQPDACCGLIGGIGNAIHVAAPTGNQAIDAHVHCLPNRNDITHILKEWQQSGLSLRGVYRSSLTAHCAQPGMFANLLADLQVTAPSACSNAGDLLCLAINLETDGRLETHAFWQRQGIWQETALVLEEDGQTKVA